MGTVDDPRVVNWRLNETSLGKNWQVLSGEKWENVPSLTLEAHNARFLPLFSQVLYARREGQILRGEKKVISKSLITIG